MDKEIEERINNISLHVKSMYFILYVSLLFIVIFTILSGFDKGIDWGIPYIGLSGLAVLTSSAIIVILKNQKFIIEQNFQQKTKIEQNDRE